MNKHQPKKFVIINADDFGITQGVNKAISELIHAGIVTSTTVMSNIPHYKDIVTLKDKVGIGVHFNLTVGSPVTEASKIPSLVDNEGKFIELPNLLKRMKQRMLSKHEVELEFTGQIERLKQLDVHIDHIDSHESLLKYPFFMKIMKKLARKYSIKAVRTYTPRKFDYTRLLSPRKMIISLYLEYQKLAWKMDGFSVADRYDSLIRFDLDDNIAMEMLRDMFNNLPEGTLEIGVHPGYCNGDIELFGDYVEKRETELRALSSDELKKLIANSHAKLMTFHEMMSVSK